MSEAFLVAAVVAIGGACGLAAYKLAVRFGRWVIRRVRAAAREMFAEAIEEHITPPILQLAQTVQDNAETQRRDLAEHTEEEQRLAHDAVRAAQEVRDEFRAFRAEQRTENEAVWRVLAEHNIDRRSS